MMASTMCCGQMNLRFRWSHTEDFVAAKKEKLLNPSLGMLSNNSDITFVKLVIYNYFTRPKHPLKVHVWGGISKHGATGICIFQGIMKKELYVDILDKTLVPFLTTVLPDHRFMQDNDPKHTSKYAKEWMANQDINWWKTPAESPDMNPIENLWHELKEYLRREIKPKTKDELVAGIQEFWKTVDIAKCKKYIGNLKKVLPKVIEVGGNATGY